MFSLFFDTEDLGKHSSMGEAALLGKQLHPCWNLVREVCIVQCPPLTPDSVASLQHERGVDSDGLVS